MIQFADAFIRIIVGLTMKKTVPVLVTGSKSKAAEIGQILGLRLESVALDIPEIQSLSVTEVARAKARAAYEKLQTAVIVDDTGMNIDALGGLPGALISWFLDSLGASGILRIMQGTTDRRASVSTCIAFCDGDVLESFEGVIQGTLADEERGTGGFGYDPIFIPSGSELTYAEMTAEEKNANSMRARALNGLHEYLKTGRT